MLQPPTQTHGKKMLMHVQHLPKASMLTGGCTIKCCACMVTMMPFESCFAQIQFFRTHIPPLHTVYWIASLYIPFIYRTCHDNLQVD